MEYCIVQEDSVTHFEDKVNQLIKEGWRTQGGVAVSWGETHTYYYQAMIRDTETQ